MHDIKPHSHKYSQTTFCIVENNRDICPRDDDGPKLNYFSFFISQIKHETIIFPIVKNVSLTTDLTPIEEPKSYLEARHR